MKKAALLAVWLFFALTAASAQHERDIVKGNGTYAEEAREVPVYTGIDVNGPFEVKLVYGNSGLITLEGEANLLTLTTTVAKEGKLFIAIRENHLVKPSHDRKITISIPYRKIETIMVTGSGSVYASRTLTGEMLELGLDGSGSIRLSADVAKAKACVIGSGGIFLNGRTGNLKCAVAGAGSIRACGLEADTVQALLSGCGAIEANCIQHITGRINGTGSIAFSGEPPQTDLRETGGGKFRPY